MRYAIAYVSKKKQSITEKEVNSILNNACNFNNANNITGLLIYSEGNFFQLIEGEENQVKELYYEKILEDTRHKNIISFVETEIVKPAYDGFYCDREASRLDVESSKLKVYFNYIKVLGPEDKNAALEVLQAFFPFSDVEHLKQTKKEF